MGHVFDQQSNFAVCAQAEHALIRKLLLFAFDEIERGIGEIERAIGSQNDIVRAVEFLPLIAIGEHFVFSVRIHGDDGAQDAGAIDQPVLLVVGVAVRIAQADDVFVMAVGKQLENLVGDFVADVEEAALIPDGSFGESEAFGDCFEFRIGRDEIPEFRASWLSAQISRGLSPRRRDLFQSRVSFALFA